MKYQCVVIGAGPAGLAYASSIKNKDSTLVIDMGKPIEKRDRHHAEECVLGAGGAGLFSDGKFSFYPSGTKIWEHERQFLKAGYDLLEQEFSPFTAIPPFPDTTNKRNLEKDSDCWCLKPYPSLYLSLDQRLQLIRKLVQNSPKIEYETEFLGYELNKDGYHIHLKNIQSDRTKTIFTKQLVWAGGRFMPLFLNCTKQFRRYEFGFRIEGPAELIQKKTNLIDPKYILDFEDQDIECRTFCWCERGEVVPTSFKHIQTYSGRSDCAPTDRTNFGFNFRIKDASLISNEIFHELTRTKFYQEKLKNLPELLKTLPPCIEEIIFHGVLKLKKKFPELDHNDIVIKGPTIEGVGEYPLIDHTFCLQDSPGIYVIGDCSGIYRGIIASMLSGYILASRHNLNQ